MARKQLTLADLLYRLGYENETEFVKDAERIFGRVEREAQDSGKDSSKKFSSSFKSTFAATGLGAFVGSIFADAFGSASRAAISFTKEMAQRGVQIQGDLRKIETVFADTLPTIQSWAEENATALGLTSTQLLGLTARTQDLLVPLGFSRDRATDLTSEINNLLGPLAEWSQGTQTVTSVNEILNAALLGERERLKGLGIDLKQADIDTRLAAKGFDELTGEAKKQETAIATLELIYEKSADAQQAFADGGDEIVRKQAEATSIIEEQKDAIALRLIPITETYYTTVLPALLSVLEDVIDRYEDWQFILTGTNDTLRKMENEFVSSVGADVARLGNEMQEAQGALAKLREERDRLSFEAPDGFMLNAAQRITQAQVADLDQQIVEAEALLEGLDTELRTAVEERNRKREEEANRPPPPAPTPTPEPTPTPTGGSGSGGGRSTSTRESEDALVAEAKAVGADLRRLQTELDAELLEADVFAENLEAHLRRIDGLLGRATSREQRQELASVRADLLRTLDGQMVDVTITPTVEVDQGEPIQIFGEKYDPKTGRMVNVGPEFGVTVTPKVSVPLPQVTAEVEQGYLELLRISRGFNTEFVTLQAELGRATKDEVVAALREQEGALEQLLAGVREGSDDWETFGKALVRVREDLDRLDDGRVSVPLPQASASVDADYLALLDTARGKTVEFINLQQRLGNATEDDVVAALEDQRRALEQLTGSLSDGSTSWTTYAGILATVIERLGRIAEDSKVTLELPEAKAELTEESKAYLQRIEDVGQNVEARFLDAGRSLADGIADGDLEGALNDILGNASDFFIGELVKGALGPLAKSLGEAASQSAAANGGTVLGPLGIALGIGALALGFLGSGGRSSPTREENNQASGTSGAPEVNYNLSAEVSIAAGADFNDPAFYQRWRDETTTLLVELLGSVKREEAT